jgi:hypothetical protein
VWKHITEVDIASFQHPGYLAAIGVPKPLRAEIVASGVGGSRVAYFSGGRRFSQRITDWSPPSKYAFTFHADPGFRVGFLLDLAEGPFQMLSGAYNIERTTTGVRLTLSSAYALMGIVGFILAAPVTLVLHLFQT